MLNPHNCRPTPQPNPTHICHSWSKVFHMDLKKMQFRDELLHPHFNEINSWLSNVYIGDRMSAVGKIGAYLFEKERLDGYMAAAAAAAEEEEEGNGQMIGAEEAPLLEESASQEEEVGVVSVGVEEEIEFEIAAEEAPPRDFLEEIYLLKDFIKDQGRNAENPNVYEWLDDEIELEKTTFLTFALAELYEKLQEFDTLMADDACLQFWKPTDEENARVGFADMIGYRTLKMWKDDNNSELWDKLQSAVNKVISQPNCEVYAYDPGYKADAKILGLCFFFFYDIVNHIVIALSFYRITDDVRREMGVYPMGCDTDED